MSRKLQSPTYTAWIEDYEMKKIVCEVSSEEKLLNIYDRFVSEMDRIDKYWGTVVCEKIYDNGHTEFDGKTLTGIVIFDKKEYPSYIKRLRLYK